MEKESKLKGLVGQDLAGFRIVEMTEVYKTDVDGRKTVSVGFFKDPDIAAAFAGVQKDASDHKIGSALVLTNGEVGYTIEKQWPVKLFNDEQETLAVIQKIIAKLSPVERKILGFTTEQV